MAGRTARVGRPPAGPGRREAIMDAATQCFVDRGFYGTAIPLIAKKASIASGTIYHHFDSKEALVNALYRRWKSEVSRRVLTAFPQAAPIREQFRVMWREMVNFAVEHPAASAFIELHNHGSYLDDESLAVDANLQKFVVAMVVRAQHEGVFKATNPTLLMELVFGAFRGMMRAHWEGRMAMTPELLETSELACWDAVAAHP